MVARLNIHRKKSDLGKEQGDDIVGGHNHEERAIPSAHKHSQPIVMSLAAVKEGDGVMEDEDSALTPIVVLGQHYEVINDHCLVNTDFILACDEFRVEKRHDEQEGEEKGRVGTHFPNRYDDNKLVGLSIAAVEEEHNDEELGFGKSHKDIPSTGDQGVEIVQKGEAPIIEETRTKKKEHLDDSPRGSKESTLNGKEHIHPLMQPPNYVKTVLCTWAKLELVGSYPPSKDHGTLVKVTTSFLHLDYISADTHVYRKEFWGHNSGCIEGNSTKLMRPRRGEEILHEGSKIAIGEVAGLLSTAVKHGKIINILSHNKVPCMSIITSLKELNDKVKVSSPGPRNNSDLLPITTPCQNYGYHDQLGRNDNYVLFLMTLPCFHLHNPQDQSGLQGTLKDDTREEQVRGGKVPLKYFLSA
ncbi:hypothetical protein KI387_038942 [Taxus chinensis]|uniref:Uncharacterized protein n=1 Tax=Taxus chinensis TaxID=29808 RepID=A0AA38CCX7_TAXCH|nr:hypothetical protein KI387_038942 [Taxus chinensis]